MPGRLVHRVWQHDPTIHAPARYKRACSYHAFIPDELSDVQLNIDSKLAGIVSEAEQAIQALNFSEGKAFGPLSRLLLRTESIASSKIEGMQLGARELARAEAKRESGRKAGPTAVEILANIDAMVQAVDHAATVITFGPAEVAAIHERLMTTQANRRMAGRIRTQQNWIGGNDYNPCGADFVPPPPEEVVRLLADLCAAVNDDQLPPLIQAALVHAQFETIHPFEDGNGRTGRALIHVILRRRGLAPSYVPPVSVVLAGGKKKYIDGLTAFRTTAGTLEWVEMFAGATSRAAHLARTYLRDATALADAWRAQLATSPFVPRSDAAAWAIIDILPAHPIITAHAAIHETRRAKAAVYAGLAVLEQAGIITPLGTSPRNQLWEAAGLLELIDGVESGVANLA